jgi:hypothetical protein
MVPTYKVSNTTGGWGEKTNGVIRELSKIKTGIEYRYFITMILSPK